MFARLFSHDLPQSRLLRVLLLGLLGVVLCAPWLSPGARFLNAAASICVYGVLAASYDMLLGYTGIVSFAHTMFFGIGAYGVGLACAGDAPGMTDLLLGVAGALLLSFLLALLIGLFALRVRALFYSMITLAFASTFAVLASQLSEWTGGEDGKTFVVPTLPGLARWFGDVAVFGVPLDARLLSYYLVAGASLALFLLMLRIVNSPFGRVLQALRENDFRAEALGFPTVRIRVAINIVAALIATLAGVLLAVWLQYVGPKTTLGFEIMTDVLLMVVIGGMGRLYGAVLGAALFIVAQNYLKSLLALGGAHLQHLPVLGPFLHPDRWLFWLGLSFVLAVYFFPGGIVGRCDERGL